MESSDGFNINPSKTVASRWKEVQAGVDLLIIMMMIMIMILWYRLSKVFIFILDWNPTRWSGGLTGLSTLWWNCYQDAKANRNVCTAVGLFVVGGGIGLGCEASLMRIIPHQSKSHQSVPLIPGLLLKTVRKSLVNVLNHLGNGKTHHYILSLDATFHIIVNYQI